MEILLDAELELPLELEAELCFLEELDAELETTVSVRAMDYPEYGGPTEFEPSESAQVIATASSTVLQDIIIRPIPSNYGRIEYDGAALSVI